MRCVISAATAPPRLLTANLRAPSARGEQDRMGCSTSSQTSAVDTTRPSSKPEESNGASTTGATGESRRSALVVEMCKYERHVSRIHYKHVTQKMNE